MAVEDKQKMGQDQLFDGGGWKEAPWQWLVKDSGHFLRQLDYTREFWLQ